MRRSQAQADVQNRLIVITGTSGAGKTTAFNWFEDAGFYAVDNLPPVLLPQMAAFCAQTGRHNALAVVDSRAGAAISQLSPALDQVAEQTGSAELLFLDASDEVLVRRFKETRRPHPIFRAGEGTILDAVRKERSMLTDLRARAQKIIDTSNLTAAEFRLQLSPLTGSPPGGGLIITIVSFGFKHGLPVDADLVFDVRFLRNPHYVPELRPLIGTHPDVAGYVHGDPLTQPFMQHLQRFIDFTIPQYRREGKAYLTIAIGCTGGRHRSVTLSEDLGQHLRQTGCTVYVTHRDIEQRPIVPEDSR